MGSEKRSAGSAVLSRVERTRTNSRKLKLNKYKIWHFIFFFSLVRITNDQNKVRCTFLHLLLVFKSKEDAFLEDTQWPNTRD